MSGMTERGDGFTQDLLAALPDGAARCAAQRVLNRWAGQRVYIRVTDARRAAARAMLDAMAAGLPQADAVRALARRLGCTERQARNLLNDERSEIVRQRISASGLRLTSP